jgi:hypothetical protein
VPLRNFWSGRNADNVVCWEAQTAERLKLAGYVDCWEEGYAVAPYALSGEQPWRFDCRVELSISTLEQRPEVTLKISCAPDSEPTDAVLRLALWGLSSSVEQGRPELLALHLATREFTPLADGRHAVACMQPGDELQIPLPLEQLEVDGVGFKGHLWATLMLGDKMPTPISASRIELE